MCRVRVIVVAGARPNFIKIAPLVPTLIGFGIDAGIVHTGQHYDALMSDVFFEDLSIPRPRWALEVGSGSQATQTAAAMTGLEDLFARERPDCVVVVGDVNSTLAGALAAVKLGIPVVHLEAGLRSWDVSMPEEINRVLTDRIASLLLTPGTDADAHLLAEGVGAERIAFVGNIMAESLLANIDRARDRHVAEGRGLKVGDYLLSTCHRPENTDEPGNLLALLNSLESAPLPVLLLAHPRTRGALERHGIGTVGSNVVVAEPVGYLDMLSLQADAAAIVTDSGGIQEESCMLHVPCVTVRNNTERPVTVHVGANRVVPARQDAIAGAIDEALASPRTWPIPERWDTEVSARVARVLLEAHASGFPPFERKPS